MLTSKGGFSAVILLTTTALFAAPAMASTENTQPLILPNIAAHIEADNPVHSAPVEIALAPDGSVQIPAKNHITPTGIVTGMVTGLDTVRADEGRLTLARASQEIEIGKESLVGGEGASGDFEISGNVALVSDYRFRGVSFSGGDPALQGGIDIVHSSGFYVGTWGSSISGPGELEVDLYGGWSGDVTSGLTLDVGLLYYSYPAADGPGDTDYFEPYASVSTTFGPVSATLGGAYAWDQGALGDDRNLYVYTDFEAAIPSTPVTLTAHIGYTDGAFSTDTDRTSFDWGLGASYAITSGLSLGFNYVDTQGPKVEDFTDAGFFFTLKYSM